MVEVIWWLGAIHLALYVSLGTMAAVTWAVWKLHALGRYHAMIIPWHIDRLRKKLEARDVR